MSKDNDLTTFDRVAEAYGRAMAIVDAANEATIRLLRAKGFDIAPEVASRQRGDVADAYALLAKLQGAARGLASDDKRA